MNTAKLFYLSFILLFIESIYAQKPTLQKIELPDELYSINSLFCHQNSVWLASAQGLYQFDGTKFKRFYEENKSELYKINCIKTAMEGSFWWGTYNGFLVQFKNGKIINSYDIKSVCSNEDYLVTSLTVGSIKKDEDEVLLTTAGGEIISVNTQTKKIQKLEGPVVTTIYAIQYGYEPMIWLCTSDGFYTRNKKSKWKRKSGLYTAYQLQENNSKYWAIGRNEKKESVFMLYFSAREDAPTKKYSWKQFDLSKLTDRYVRFYEVGFTENELAWIASRKGLIRYNPHSASAKLYEELNHIKIDEIKHISVQNKNILWLSSSGRRFYRVILN